MGPVAQLLDGLAEKTHVSTVASQLGDRTLADRSRRDTRAIHGELFTSRSRWRDPARKG
jgi:hypothetical protein